MDTILAICCILPLRYEIQSILASVIQIYPYCKCPSLVLPFDRTCHGIARCIQPLPFNINFAFVHLISHYMNVHVVGNSTALIQTQSLPKLAMGISRSFHDHFHFYSSCTIPLSVSMLVVIVFIYLLQC